MEGARTNVQEILLTCEATDLKEVHPTANNELQNMLQKNLWLVNGERGGRLFDRNETKLRALADEEKDELENARAQMSEESKGRLDTFNFGLTLYLSAPIEL